MSGIIGETWVVTGQSVVECGNAWEVNACRYTKYVLTKTRKSGWVKIGKQSFGTMHKDVAKHRNIGMNKAQ